MKKSSHTIILATVAIGALLGFRWPIELNKITPPVRSGAGPAPAFAPFQNGREKLPTEDYQSLSREPTPDRDEEEAMLRLIREDPDQALVTLQAVPGWDEQERRLLLIATALALSDHALAANLADALPRDDSYLGAMAAIMVGYAQHDPPAALAWAFSLPEGDAKRLVLDRLTSALLTIKPQQAANLVLELPGEEDRQHLMLTILQNWARRDAHAAISWAQEMPAGDLRQNTLRTISRQIANDSS